MWGEEERHGLDAGKALEVAPQQLWWRDIGSAMAGEVQKRSVHPLVFRPLQTTHHRFVPDNAKRIRLDEERHKVKTPVKLHTEYSSALHKPTLQEKLREKGGPSTWDPCGYKQHSGNQGQEAAYVATVTHPYPSGRSVAWTAYTDVQRMPSEYAARSPAVALPAPQSRLVANRTAAGGSDIYRHAGISELSQPSGMSVAMVEAGVYKNSALMSKKAPTVPKPQWRPPWKLYRVISGHLGWVRCIAVEPGNQWFVTGSADRTIKIWDLASGKLKLSLGGLISTVRGVIVSARSPHLFSCGGYAEVKCWDVEYKKVIREYHGHQSVVYGLDLHPTIDLLVTCGQDTTARVWDARTKASVHTLSGHTEGVATVKCHAAEAEVITGSHDATIRIWDLVAGKTRVTLTNGKKSARSVVLHPRHYTFASGSPGYIKQWKLPNGGFIQNLYGHNAIINTLAVNSNGVLVSGGGNGTMHFWDWETGCIFQRVKPAVQPGSLDSDSGISACVFDQSGSILLTAEADKTTKVYKEDDTATEQTHPVSWK